MEHDCVMEALRMTSKGKLKYNRNPEPGSTLIASYALPSIHHENQAHNGAEIFKGLWREPDGCCHFLPVQDETERNSDMDVKDADLTVKQGTDQRMSSKSKTIFCKVSSTSPYSSHRCYVPSNSSKPSVAAPKISDSIPVISISQNALNSPKSSSSSGDPPADTAAPSSSTWASHVSPHYGISCLAVEGFREDAKKEMQHRQVAKLQEFEAHAKILEEHMGQLLQGLEKKQQQQLMDLYSSHKEMLRLSDLETEKRQQSLKESHLQHSKNLEAILRDAEVKRQELEREKRERELTLLRIHTEHAEVHVLANRLKSAYDSCEHKAYLVEAAHKSAFLAEQIVSSADATLNSAQDNLILDSQLEMLLKLKGRISNALDFLTKQIEEVETQIKAAAEKSASKPPSHGQTQPTTEDVSHETPPPSDASVSTGSSQSATAGKGMELTVAQQVLKCYAKSRLCLDGVDKSLWPFTSNIQNKKYIFELRKFVNTTINSISGVSGSHLRDRLQRLSHLLAGSSVTTSIGPLSTCKAPEASLYCKNLIAKMIVKKGEEEVSSNHESAFPLAAVAVGLWAESSDIGDQLLSYFYTVCPYLVPYCLPRQEGQNSLDYHRALGYKVVDGEVEAQDKFLRRMTGLMRLYAAIMVSPLPHDSSCPHPWGLDQAWVWLARVMNQDPHPDITATLLYGLLQVTGHALLLAYRTQFAKLLYLLHRDYLPRIQQVDASGGPVCRLQSFLEMALKNACQIPKPNGLLPPNFSL